MNEQIENARELQQGLDAYVVEAVRTPRGAAREGGALASVKSIHLLEGLYREMGERLGPALQAIDDVVLGCVTAVGDQGSNIAKISSLYAGWPERISGVTINRFCASGLDAISQAAVKTHSGMEDLVIAGGVESMSRVPMLKDRGAWFADPEVAAKTGFIHMGISADLIASLGAISREACDAFAERSHQRAFQARERRFFEKSLLPVLDRSGKLLLDHDEAVNPSIDRAQLANLPSAFAGVAKDGASALIHKKYPALDSKDLRFVHTLGSSPARVDGAALVAIANSKAIRDHSLKARGRILSYANASVEPIIMLTGAIEATRKALDRAGLHPQQIDLWEVNESFAATVIDFMRKLEIGVERVNVNGGAIAMGHALGATGSILVGTLLDELERRDLRYGCVAICAGAGIGQALVIERVQDAI